MIKSISLITQSGSSNCKHTVVKDFKTVLDLSAVANEKSFDLIITFENKISEFRNHDYTWIKCSRNLVSAPFSPKIVRLSNGFLVQANINFGIWEVKKNNSKVLIWRFNPENAAPLSAYTGNKNERIVHSANTVFDFPENPALLFSNANAVEFSRSAHPFSAIACFTDHCDFDTPESLPLQREFFNEHSIKVTKGFFLNQYSKRHDNASFENSASELAKWRSDGHELAYHSLSQSIKNDAESFDDFFGVTPPFPDIPTWIDHGYQPYNLSLYRENNIDPVVYENTLKAKNIATLWNYIDSATATSGVINQLNPDHFTLDKFYKGNPGKTFTQRLTHNVKNTMAHHYADPKNNWGFMIANGKRLFKKRNVKSFFPFLWNVIVLSFSLLRVFLFWNWLKNKPYKLAKYTPVIFGHTISKEKFYIFQTMEMVDFKKALSKENISTLVKESGLFIAHTYFSVPMRHHHGRIFKTPEQIDSEVAENFRVLGGKIKTGEIWNPTLNELVVFLANFEKAVSDVDGDGNIFATSASGLHYRTVN
ncbi:MAG TPA: hypothetical protein VK623_12335 [Flavobacterium sp.]|nr:hypothetical protein [Flavobacterium sp.]